jgi:hypothetical protein
MTDDELKVEHEALKQQTAELQREHDALSDNGLDAAHAEHREKLRRKIAELEAHMARLQAGRQNR